MTAGASFAARALALDPDAAIDLRLDGVRVGLGPDTHADTTRAVSEAAAESGLVGDPTPLARLSLVVETRQPEALAPFWSSVLGYLSTGEVLRDPLRRDPTIVLAASTQTRPLRSRLHVDVVRPAEVVAAVQPGEPSGPYGVRHADPDGNEVDLVPGDPLGDDAGTEDWRVVFGALACYRVDSAERARDLALTVAEVADDTGFPLLVDLRPGLVLVDSGKDRADADAHGLDLDFVDVAARVQSAARAAGGVADVSVPRFVQIMIDATDVTAVRAFWAAVLGYVADRRDGLADLVDPRRLGPVVLFQDLDAGDTERRSQRDRQHLRLEVPHDLVEARVAAALRTGGRVLEETPASWRVADPEGNEVVLVATPADGEGAGGS